LTTGRACYSSESSCNEGEFTWLCYDSNRQFDIYKKQGNSARGERQEHAYEPWKYESEDGGQIFDNKSPEKCE